MVSTHAPTRGATRGERLDVAGVVVVSTHAPTRGATRRGPCAASPICRFNPRAHAGRDDIWIARSIQQSDVSTHAPTRGATTARSLRNNALSFQPTRPRGARPVPFATPGQSKVFQPTRPRGARRCGRWQHYGGESVSTHAPTRGATHGDGKISPLHEFQPTRPRGARLDSPTSLIVRLMFQPTRPRGARHNWWGGYDITILFQPTRPRGARLRRPAALPRWLQFQPTRPRGARRVAAADLGAVGNVSTHAPTRGATATSWQAFSRAPRFNPRAHAGRDSHDGDCVGDRVSTHAPTRGATRSRTSSAGSPQSFQPTRPRGARRKGAPKAQAQELVSTHAPTRGATR